MQSASTKVEDKLSLRPSHKYLSRFSKNIKELSAKTTLKKFFLMKINDLETFYEFLTSKFKKKSNFVIKFFVRNSEK